jgi:hypothetical protein
MGGIRFEYAVRLRFFAKSGTTVPETPETLGDGRGFLLLHGTIGALVIYRVERIPLIWYVPVDAAEISVLIRVLSWAFAKEDKPQRA